MTREEAHRFLDQTSINENSEVELLHLAPEKQKFSKNTNEESLISMKAMQEETKEAKQEKSEGSRPTLLSSALTNNGISFRKPNPYRPLQLDEEHRATETHPHEAIGSFKTEALSLESEAAGSIGLRCTYL